MHIHAPKYSLIQLLGASSVYSEAGNFKMALDVAYTSVSFYSLKMVSKLNKKKSDYRGNIVSSHVMFLGLPQKTLL